jgi:hypothetical protein
MCGCLGSHNIEEFGNEEAHQRNKYKYLCVSTNAEYPIYAKKRENIDE